MLKCDKRVQKIAKVDLDELDKRNLSIEDLLEEISEDKNDRSHEVVGVQRGCKLSLYLIKRGDEQARIRIKSLAKAQFEVPFRFGFVDSVSPKAKR